MTSGPQRHLKLLDVICINIGIIVAVGVFESTPFIASRTQGPEVLLTLWLAGGVAALMGALCYAELTTRFPRQGGEYVFLTEAFGESTGFVFAWSDFWIIRPGNIGVMAIVFAKYSCQAVQWENPSSSSLLCLAILAIVFLTITNVLGVRSGKWTQNALTIAKVSGILAVIATGLWLLPSASLVDIDRSGENAAPTSVTWGELISSHSLAMILIMFSYGGWNEMSYVAAEMTNPRKTIIWGLIGSALAVAGIYLLLNAAFIRALGFEKFRASAAVASQLMEMRFGGIGRSLISALICISSLSAINGTMFTGSRIYYALGRDHYSLRWVGHWSQRFQVPVRAILLLSCVSSGLVIAFGRSKTGFEDLVRFTSPVFWLFFLGVGIALFVLRRRPAPVDAFRVPWGPVIPAVFCLLSLGMLAAGIRHAFAVQYSESKTWALPALWALFVIMAGCLLAFVIKKPRT